MLLSLFGKKQQQTVYDLFWEKKVLGKYQILLIVRLNRPIAYFGQHNLSLVYVLSTKPIPGICFVNQ